MPTTTVNGIELCYDTFGPDDGEPLVLINGLGSQMIRWPQGFIDLLVGSGFRVIVHDNRDVGLTQKFAEATESPAYTVNDMAADTVGLLDHLGIESAHIAGMSMGGMITQVVAIDHPTRARSIASIMSAMGDDPVLSTDNDAVKIFSEPPEHEREKAIEQDVRHRRLISGPGFEFDENAARDLATRCYDRCYDPSGRARQMVAVMSSGGRKAGLAELAVPTVVIHGTDDPLVPVENGRKMAAVVPGAELVEIEGMGHDLPRGPGPPSPPRSPRTRAARRPSVSPVAWSRSVRSMRAAASRTSSAALQSKAEWAPEPVRTADAVVLLILDGLGWNELQRRASDAPTIASLDGGPITSVVPSTTPTALSSISTGLPPAEHGVVGYRIWLGDGVLNVIRWAKQGAPPPDPTEIQSRDAFGGQALPVVTRAGFRDSKFTDLLYRGADFHGYFSTSGLIETSRVLVERGERFVYAYYDGPDLVAHMHGMRDGYFEREVRYCDGLVVQLLDALPERARWW